MLFKDILGQESAKAILGGAIRRQEVPSSYIFSGPKGVGKSIVALEFAKALNCLDETVFESGPCGACDSCGRIAARSHPDVRLISPEGANRSSIKIDQMRELMAQMNMKPYQARRKVAIIDEAESMNLESFNAILKTLEEPPQDSCLILITSAIETIPPTVVSRCQVVRFFALPVESVRRVLAERHGADGATAHYLAHLSSGRIGEAVRLMDAEIFRRKNRIIDGLLKGRTRLEDAAAEDKKTRTEELLGVLLGYFRDILITKARGERGSLINIDKAEEIAGAASKMDYRDLLGLIAFIVESQGFLKRNANPRLISNVLDIKLRRVEECTRS